MRFSVVCGDSIEVMKRIPDNAVDSVVTDPPYGLSEHKPEEVAACLRAWLADEEYKPENKRGFMGKSWDGWVPSPSIWKECYRVLKPGGHMLVFAGTRSYDLMTISLRLAGFELRDTVMWVYGCLSEDTEILTSEGWVRYHKNIEQETVCCYDIERDIFEFHKPTRSFIYANQYPAYRIRSDSTDQIVSRGHRCIVEQGGRKVFTYAEALEHEESVPFLESLSDLPETVFNFHKGPSIKKQDLLQRVLIRDAKNAGNAQKINVGTQDDRDRMRCLRKESVATHLSSPKSKKPNLFKTLQWVASRSRVETTRSQRSSSVVERFRREFSGQDAGCKQPSMERWGNLFSQTWKLLISQVCSLSDRVYTDGKKRWICYGASSSHGKVLGQKSYQNRGCPPSQSQPTGQPNRESDAVREQQTAQTVRSTRATVTPIVYTGNVWCVEVPTGAFVARREGKIFITGNSGFPKSLDVGKAIDKAAGAEREVVGSKMGLPGYSLTDGKPGGASLEGSVDGSLRKGEAECVVTAPATDEAKEWDGWGTALKPAHEPIIVVRKPLSEKTVAANVLKWGTGAINIDGCRVSTDDNLNGGAYAEEGSDRESYQDWRFKRKGGAGEYRQPIGRFPANLILSHSPDCKLVGTKKVKTGTAIQRNGGGQKIGGDGIYQGSKGLVREDTGYADDSGLEDVEVYECVDGCPIKDFPQSNSARVSGNPNNPKRGKNHIATSYGQGNDQVTNDYRDSGSAARFFYCAKASRSERNKGLESEDVVDTLREGVSAEKEIRVRNGNSHPTVKPLSLMRYLCRLVTPPGGVVLDPFSGSGSTGCGAVCEGFNFAGIDISEEYCNIARSRIRYWIEHGTDPNGVLDLES